MATGRQEHGKARAFTLVELILVMTIMLIMMGIVLPSFKGFFRADTVENEERRFVSLTRYAQSRAIVEGLPVELWMNPREGSYGMRALSGYAETEANPRTFTLDSTLQLAYSTPPSVLVRSNYWTQASGMSGTVARIRFQPDGFISDTSPANIYLRHGAESQIWIAETATHTRYAIQPGQPNRR